MIAVGVRASPSILRAPGYEAAALPPRALPRLPGWGLEPTVQRPVHARKSWQYQRTSAQALPPSETIRAVGKRMPHIQQRS